MMCVGNVDGDLVGGLNMAANLAAKVCVDHHISHCGRVLWCALLAVTCLHAAP